MSEAESDNVVPGTPPVQPSHVQFGASEIENISMDSGARVAAYEYLQTHGRSIGSAPAASGRRVSACCRLSAMTEEEIKEQADNSRKAVFVDAAAMKEMVRLRLLKPKYNVADFYSDHGLWPKIATSSVFEQLTLLTIALNAGWIAIDTDLNDSEVLVFAKVQFQVAENYFCCFFAFEWLARYLSFEKKVSGFKDQWFIFDTLMVLLMALETWCFSAFILVSGGNNSGGSSFGDASILRIARLLRLSRMCRMVKLLRAMPELMIMIKGLMAAARSVFFTLVLLIGLLFVFSIGFTQMTADLDIGERHFSQITASMYFLLVHGALLLGTDYRAQEINEAGGWMLTAAFFIFVLSGAILLMNVLIGVLCEVVSVVASTEKEEMLVTYVRSRLEQVMALIDEDGGGTISRAEFMLILENIEAMEALAEIGVDVVGLVDFADFIFGEEEERSNNRDSQGSSEGEKEMPEVELTLAEFMDVVLQLRGSNNASVKDVVDMRKLIQGEQGRITKIIQYTEQHFSQLEQSITQLKSTFESALLLSKAGKASRRSSAFTPSSSDRSMMADRSSVYTLASTVNGTNTVATTVDAPSEALHTTNGAADSLEHIAEHLPREAPPLPKLRGYWTFGARGTVELVLRPCPPSPVKAKTKKHETHFADRPPVLTRMNGVHLPKPLEVPNGESNCLDPFKDVGHVHLWAEQFEANDGGDIISGFVERTEDATPPPVQSSPTEGLGRPPTTPVDDPDDLLPPSEALNNELPMLMPTSPSRLKDRNVATV
eukprot:TRINITY_DN2651_c0_g1_i1.p1 TRINITY_DN2651_c0_g1~~TRINITY_DN2651_c0_g1_i1.p1  ORF type:complete len:772 (+),score=217.36 TRINITY_DN2651_c0_g1_i1:74-2389(+)